MKTIIQSIALFVCFMTAMLILFFGANYGMNNYPGYSAAFFFVGSLGFVGICVVTAVVIIMIDKESV